MAENKEKSYDFAYYCRSIKILSPKQDLGDFLFGKKIDKSLIIVYTLS